MTQGEGLRIGNERIDIAMTSQGIGTGRGTIEGAV